MLERDGAGRPSRDGGIRLAMTDLDGTLADTMEANWRAYQCALEGRGRALSLETYRERCDGRSYRDFLPEMLGGDGGLAEAVHGKKEECYPGFLSLARLNQPLVGILRALREAGVATALVTTASRANVDAFLEWFELEDLFDLVVSGGDVRHGKPAPDCYLLAMERLGAAPEESVIFEDSETGIAAAEASGCGVYIFRAGKMMR